jgi:hypothetical protein
MGEENSTPVDRAGLPAWPGPAIMLIASLLTVAIVFLPWARIDVTDTNIDIRNGWYSGLQLMLPLLLIILMLAPIVISALLLSGRGTRSLNLEIGLCSFAFGMEFLLLCVLLVLNGVLQDLAGKVDLFKLGLGLGYWMAVVLLIVNVLGLVWTGRKAKHAGLTVEGLAQ